MADDLKKLNKIILDGEDNIVIQDIENSSITINKNNSDELKAFFSKFENRISDFEELLAQQKRGSEVFEKLLIAHFSKEPQSVMVVGTGAYELSKEVYDCSLQLAHLLAELDCNVVVGGWQGVDYVIAEEFSKSMAQKGKRLSDKLTQVVSKGKEPIFKGGNVQFVEQGVMEWIEGLKNSKLLIMIGGEGGTYETFQYARQENIAVIPIAFTQGDAQRVYLELLPQISENKQISSENFLQLSNPSTYLESLQRIIKNILEL